MKIILEDREHGKTFKAIINAYLNNGIIVTDSIIRADYIIKKSNEMNMPITAISAIDYIMNRKNYRDYNVIIDELNCTLNSLFKNLIYATDTEIDIINLDNKTKGGE